VEPSQRVPDVYFTQDYPVLVAIARWELSKTLGRSHEAVTAAIGRLHRGGYVAVVGPLLDQKDYFIVKQLTPTGLREVGAWPNATDLADTFKRVLEREAAEADRTDPEKGKKLHQILDTARDLGTSFLAKVTADLIKSATHMP